MQEKLIKLHFPKNPLSCHLVMSDRNLYFIQITKANGVNEWDV